MSELHVFSNEIDKVIATSPEDAVIALGELGYDGETDADEYAQLSPDYKITIWCDENGEPGEIGCGTLITKTCAEWVKLGRGLLCTTEA